MDGLNLYMLVKYGAVLVAAIVIGNWFLTQFINHRYRSSLDQ
jgi:hypothetical protein